VIDEPLHLAAPLTHYLRATLTADPEGDDGMAHARLTGSQSSGILTSMSSADVLLVVPPEPVDLPAGTVLRAIALDADLGGSTEFPS
jgi:molybdopterin biosynthesis enzyme